MTSTSLRNTLAVWSSIAVALAATLVVTWILVRVLPRGLEPATSAPPAEVVVSAPPPREGVRATLTAGAVRVERELAAPAFALDAGQTLDPRLPTGAWEGRFLVTIAPGPVRRARIGAEILGGSLIIARRGDVIASGEAGAEATTVTSEPVYLPGSLVTYEYRFRSTGDGPVRLRGLWRPDEAQVDLPLPCDGGVPLREPEQGLALIQQLNCVACHRSGDDERQARLSVSPAPDLAGIGARARPDWLRRWLASPQDVRPRAAMPALFDLDDDADRETIEDLVHFLAGLGGPFGEDPAPDRDLVETGRLAYHRIGCVACHGPLDEPAAEPDPGRVAIGPVSEKTTVSRLAAFLLDPLSVRPSGRMPSLGLSPLEAESIASYLVQRDLDRRGSPVFDEFVVDDERAGRGRRAFAARGCAACHALGDPAVASRLDAPALERLDSTGGCLRPAPGGRSADYRLGEAARRRLRAALDEMGEWRSGDVPLVELAAGLDRLRCLACHEFHGAGGVPGSIDAYFTVAGEADLGDEGRLPPELDLVGARLNPGWLQKVLEESGAARPYMHTRMPQFGDANVGEMPAGFAAAAGASRWPRPGPPTSDEATDAGRVLVGAGGFNCLECHAIAGHASAGLPGPDLVQMVERLRYPWFDMWLHDPRQLRPGTRMPTYFYAGRSGLDVLGGDARRQVDAIWSYLSLGEFLPLPDGLTDPDDYELAVQGRPIVLRTFMEGIGPRAIACGFPEGVHFAFDAADCRLKQVWTGRFLNASTIWSARGGSETNPGQGLAWQARGDRVLGAGAAGARFRGYRLDDRGVPEFEYDLQAGDAAVRVRDRVRPSGRNALARRLELRGPPGAVLTLNLKGRRVVRAEPPLAGPDDGRLVLGADGRQILELELTW